jgi:RHS repeat-associated protein
MYDAYGTITVLDPSFLPLTSSPLAYFTFTGREYDGETCPPNGGAGLYHYRARTYGAALGRFYSRDPLEYVDGMNLYSYVRSQVTRMIDPSGLKQFVFNSYIKDWDWFNDDDIYVHHRFSINVECTSNGVPVNMGTVGPAVIQNLFAASEVDGPVVIALGNGDLQADWSGIAIDSDYDGFTIGSVAGAAFGFIILGPSPEDPVFALIGGAIMWSGELFFDDEVQWVYKRSATFSCVPCLSESDGGQGYDPVLIKNGIVESYEDNDWFDFYQEHDPIPTPME